MTNHPLFPETAGQPMGWYTSCQLTEWSDQARVLEADARFGPVTGHWPAENLPFAALLPGGGQADYWETMRGQLAQGGTAFCQHRMLDGEGNLFYALSHARGPAQGGPVALTLVRFDRHPQLQQDVRALSDALPCGIARFSVTFRDGVMAETFEYANRMFYTLIGHDPEAFAGLSREARRALIGESEQKILRKRYQEAAAHTGKPVQVYYSIRRQDGTQAYLLSTMRSLGQGKDGCKLFCTYQDMTALHETQAALAAQKERIDLIAEATRERFVEYDVAGDRLTLLGQSGNQAMDFALEGFLGKDALRSTVHPDDYDPFRQAMEEALSAPGHGSLEARMSVTGEEKQWRRVHFISTAGEGGKVTRIVGRLTNIEEEKHKEHALRQKAERDALTQLYSRGAAEMLMEHFLKRENDLHSDQHHAVLMIDLDNFKDVNDNFTHAFGDVVLTEVGDILRESFRTSDILGRLGGDEFIVLMKNYRSREALEHVASRVCAAVARTYKTPAGKTFMLSASIGIACYPEHGTMLPVLYQRADLANYEAKANGKNGWHLYTGETVMRYQSQREEKARETELLQIAVERALLDTLHARNDRDAAVTAALEVLAQSFGAQRAFIQEFDISGACLPAAYQWCEAGYELSPGDFCGRPEAAYAAFCRRFDGRGLRMAAHVDRDAPEALRGYYHDMGVRSLLHFALRRNGVICGFVGLDCAKGTCDAKLQTLEELGGIAKVLALFARQRVPTSLSTMLMDATALLDNTDLCSYLVDAQTHELIFVNQKMRGLMPQAREGELCHVAVRDLDAPCEDCPIAALDREDKAARTGKEMYFKRTHTWGQVFSGWFDLGRSNRYCLFELVDITDRKTGGGRGEGA